MKNLDTPVKVVVLSNPDVIPRTDLVGQWLDDSHYHTLVQDDIDLYLPPKCLTEIDTDDCDKNCGKCESGIDERNIVFKFRKNYFSKELVKGAYDGLRDAATVTENRGIASGIKAGIDKQEEGREWITNYQYDIFDAIFDNQNASLDEDEVDPIDDIRNKYPTPESRLKAGGSGRNNVWVISRFRDGKFDFEGWVDSLKGLSRAERVASAEEVQKMVSETSYGCPVNSGIAGWYDRYPRIPFGRATSYTENNPEKFALSYPYFQKLSEAFEKLLPWRYNNQKAAADKIDQKFLIPGTPFTTITVNKNFRTAAHYDPANMENGFANLCCFSTNDNYEGGYLVFPEIGYAVDIRPGDVLFVNNQAGMHGNTEIKYNDPEAERLTLIAFFHERMLELGSFDYEQTRKEFVEYRRKNKDHPLQRKLWNGISPGMWSDSEDPKQNFENAKEWYEYLKAKGSDGELWLDKYHPWLKNHFENKISLEDFF